MGKVEKISIALTDEMLTLVKEAVSSGDYASSSEVIREALREWKSRRTRERAAIDELRELVREADASGYEPFEGVADVKARGRELLAKIQRA